MKKLKLDHAAAQKVLSGKVSSTWRLYDDKDLTVNDAVALIDKVDPAAPQTWRVIGVATITRVVEKRIGDIEQSDMRAGEDFDSPEILLEAMRQRYGMNVEWDTAIKLVYFDFTPGTADNAIPKGDGNTRPKAESITMYADGGSRGNPGPSACGYVLINEAGEVLVDKGVYLGITTNNQAEYQGLKSGLLEAKAMGARNVDVRLDSLLVVNQMKGIFKVKNRDLWPIHESIKKLVAGFEKVTFSHVPREMNKLADSAVNRVLDEQMADR